MTPPADPDQVTSVRVWPCGCFSYEGGPESGRTIGILGTEVRFSAAALSDDGSVLYASETHPDRFSWSCSAPGVAAVALEVDAHSGIRLPVVRGVADGTTTITASFEGVAGELRVTVRDRARLAWSTPLPALPSGTQDVAVGADGTIYVSTFGDDASRWFAVSPGGDLLWTLDLPDSRGTPAIGSDGTLYGGLREGGVVAVSSGGGVLWMLEGLDGIRSSPAIGPDGTIYLAGLGHVYAVSPGGSLLWEFAAGSTVFALSSPAVANDGTVYVGGTNGVLYALDPEGSLAWTFETGGDNIIYSPPAIADDGTVYFGSLHALHAIDPDGSGGRVLLERTVSRSPSIGQDGAIYVGVGWGTGGLGVHAVDPSGAMRWHSRPGTSATPVLGADGSVYVTGTGPSGEPVVYALDSQGALRWDYAAPSGAFWRAAAIGVDGAIVAVTRDPVVLYSIVENEGANGGHAGAAWPQAQGDRANSGRAGG